jgi:hypothetical protein
MANKDCAFDSELCQGLRNKFCLTCGRGVIVARRPRTPTVARAIKQDDAMCPRELVAQGEPHVFHVSARAMDQHYGGFGAWASTRKTKFSDVQTRVSDH